MRVAVVAPEGFHLPMDDGVEAVDVPADGLARVDVDVLLLDISSFESEAALVRARDARPRLPALVLAPAERAAALLATLRACDDVALPDTPPAALVRRMRLLLAARAAERDPLTGLLTRQELRVRLEAALADASGQRPVSLVFVDLDHFKRFNDDHGHLAGDDALREVARRLRAALAPEDVAARIGGEEFAVLLRDGEASARWAAEGIRQAVSSRPVRADVGLTVSIGLGTVTAPSAVREPMRLAEEALYAAKASGRDRVVSWRELLDAADGDGEAVAAQSFEHMTHVVAERVAEAITRRGRRVIREAREQADVDGLTRLYNRRYLDRRLPVEVAGASERSAPLTVALADVDFFGQVNKTHGWPAGDAVLIEVARRVREAVRKDDWVARYGGEELCIVLRDTLPEDAAPILERVREAVGRETFRTPDGLELVVTISVGAAGRLDDDEPASLLGRVSDELLKAKRTGKNRVSMAP